MIRLHIFLLFITLTYSKLSGQVIINEISSNNQSAIQDDAGAYSDWIEFYNPSGSPVDLLNYRLSDNISLPSKWVFPSLIVPANGYLIVFASGKNTGFHTNFSLSSQGETLVFSDASGTLIESIVFPAMGINNTYGRSPDGSADWKFFNPGTYSAANGTANSYAGYVDATVSFSVPAGFYSGTQNVTCSCSDPSAELRYTLDGSKPTSSSTLYSTSISLISSKVLRVGCFKSGYLTRKFETNTYLINDAGTTLPVFSISTHPGNLFAADTGIYMPGPGASPTPPHYGANYWQDWEREVHIEYFDKNKTEQFEQDCGIKIFGGWSRAHGMKSVRLIPDDKYGKDKFTYPLFPERPDVEVYDQIHLRNGGNDFNFAHLRDQINHRALGNSENILGNKTHIDFSAYEPVAVFINGAYWGVHHMRERYNHGYFESHHNVKQGEFEMLEMDGDVIKVDNAHFLNMLDFVANNDMTITANYNQVKQWLDIENYTDYFIAQTYHTNWDWPQNNIKYWRPNTAEGKWRYLYYDTDFALGLYGATYNAASFNELAHVINPASNTTINPYRAGNPHSDMFKKMLTNTEFRNYFVNRYADLVNTVYKPANYKAVYNQLKSQLDPEMGRHFAKWPEQLSSESNWSLHCADIPVWMDARPAYARTHVRTQFSLAKTVDVTLNVSPAGAGVIKISSIIPDTYPWTGTYFDGVPVTITAIANPGYVFNNWSSSSVTVASPSNSSITLNINANNTFTANFSATTSIPRITISEINYNSGNGNNSGNWVEFHNYGNASMDLSGWTFKDSKDFNAFVFPNGTTLNAGEYLVLANDMLLFNAAYPAVSNVLGPFDFQLGNGGETLRLFDTYNRLYLSVKYNDKAPWPLIANGLGATLELDDPQGDLNDGNNWFDGCKGGSPGTAYVACPCQDINLGADKVLCGTGGSVSLNSGLTAHPNRSFKWFYNGAVLPLVNPSLTVSAVGKYTVLVDSMGCLKLDEIKVLADLSLDLGEDLHLCDPVTRLLDPKANVAGASYSWTKDATPVEGANTSTLEVSSSGTYALTVSLAGCTPQTDEVIVTSDVAEPVNGVRAGAGTVDLSVNGTGDYEWYETPVDVSPLHNGSDFATPVISTTTTYYVEDASSFQGVTGRIDNSGSGYPNNSFATWKLKFNVYLPFTLEAVTVYTNLSNVNLSVRAMKSDGTPAHTKSILLPTAGKNRVVLGWDMVPGTNYILDAVGTSGGYLYMNDANPGYPYSLSNSNGQQLVSITYEPSWASDNYYYFYNWEIKTGTGLGCERVPVTARILDKISGPASVETNQTYTYSVPAEVNTLYEWILPSGASFVSGEGTNSIDVQFSSAVNEKLILKRTTPYGVAGDTLDLSILTAMPNALPGGDSYELYPNPFSEEAGLLIHSKRTEKVSLRVSDRTGVVIYQGSDYSTNQMISLGKHLSSGVYTVEVMYGETLFRVKVVKVK